MNWPDWMEDNVWQWLTGIIIAIIGIIVPIVLALRSKRSSKVSTIKGDGNIQVVDSSEVTIITNEIDPKERAKQDTILQNTEENNQLLKEIHERLDKKHIEAIPQLVNELKDKIQSLENELEELSHTTKDKRAEEALVAFKRGNNKKAITLFEALQKEERGKLAKTAYNLGNVYFVELDFQKALNSYLDAVRVAPDNSTYLNEAGFTFYTLAQYVKAIEYYEKAIKSALKTFGEDHPNVATLLNNLGFAWKVKGEYNKAIEYYEKALKSDLKTFGGNHPDVARDWNNLGFAWKANGVYDKAIEYYEKALESFKKAGLLHQVAIVEENIKSISGK